MLRYPEKAYPKKIAEAAKDEVFQALMPILEGYQQSNYDILKHMVPKLKAANDQYYEEKPSIVPQPPARKKDR